MPITVTLEGIICYEEFGGTYFLCSPSGDLLRLEGNIRRRQFGKRTVLKGHLIISNQKNVTLNVL